MYVEYVEWMNVRFWTYLVGDLTQHAQQESQTYVLTISNISVYICYRRVVRLRSLAVFEVSRKALDMKNAPFLDVTSCSLAEIHERFEECIDSIFTNVYQITRCHIQKLEFFRVTAVRAQSFWIMSTDKNKYRFLV
jgi:hypothetical protein